MTENKKDLNKQIYVFSIDTAAFYNKVEQKIHSKLLKVYNYKKILKEKEEKTIKELKLTERKTYANEREKMLRNMLSNTEIKSDRKKIRKKLNGVREYKRFIKEKTKHIDKHKKYANEREKMLEKNLYQSFTENGDVRQLSENSLKDKSKIGLFDSVLSRTLGIEEDATSTDIIIVRSYYYQVLEDIITNGFIHNGKKYIFFSASAGQIRTKKSVFIREDVWNEHKDSLTCGLNIEDINKQGGVNTNKYLAYLALANSASIEWEKFDIDRCIVVNDLETDVESLVDYIDRDTYKITPQQEMNIPIEHTDGCGMVLESISKKPFMCRLPWIKGLLVPFPYNIFTQKNENKTKVKDIYGKTWDIVKDDIQIIFTKSQFKMWKYYQLEENKEESWDNYKTKFKENNCKAAKLNEEEDLFTNAKLNYQMLQTLTDLSDKELELLANSTVKDIEQIGESKEVMLKILGATEENERKNPFQKAVLMYPELLADNYTRKAIKDTKKSLVKDAKSGKLNIIGKYTFIIPDLYAFAEYLFLGERNPRGLLNNGEVYCDLYDEQKLDILRSPHLYLEHAIRKNTLDEEKKKWFITHGVYTSVHDPISKILQFDVDGDKSLVVADETLIQAAERNILKYNIVPLYYEMKKAEAQIIDNKKIFDSLKLAYKANIGEISNKITKIWNRNNVNSTDLDTIKLLCMENNFTIDYAKTLWMPTRPPEIDVLMKEYSKGKLPHFFKYAKDKENHKVEKIDGTVENRINNSVVNRLDYIITHKRIHFSRIAGQFDYKMLMKVKSRRIDEAIVERYVELIKGKRKLMNENKEATSRDRLWVYKYIREELLKVDPNIQKVTDVLVRYLYAEKKSERKETLWKCFGKMIINNLSRNIQGTMQCHDCGKRVKKTSNSMKYCSKCAEKKEKNRLSNRKKGA